MGRIIDTFTESSAGVLLQNHVADSGQTWSKHPSYTGCDAVIDNGRVHKDSANAEVAYISSEPSATDQFIEAIVTNLTNVAKLSLFLRFDPSADTGYELRYDSSAGAGGAWILYKHVAGVVSSIVTIVSGVTPAADRSELVRFCAIDDCITVQNGATYLTHQVDSSVSTAGRIGVGFNYATSGGSSSTGFHLEQIVAGDVYFKDTFSGETAGTTLQSHTAEVGGQWVQRSDMGAGILKINSSARVYKDHAADANDARYQCGEVFLGTTQCCDTYVFVASAVGYTGIQMRQEPALYLFYGAKIDPAPALYLVWQSNSTYTPFSAQGAITLTANHYYLQRFELIGFRMRIWFIDLGTSISGTTSTNSGPKFSADDSVVQGPGSLGLGIDAAGSSTTGVQVEKMWAFDGTPAAGVSSAAAGGSGPIVNGGLARGSC